MSQEKQVPKFERKAFTKQEMEEFIAAATCDRCICAGISFVEMLKIAQEHNLTAEQLIEQTGIGSDCEVCVPYIHEAIKTGNPSIPIEPATQTHMWKPDPHQGIHPIDEMFPNRKDYKPSA